MLKKINRVCVMHTKRGVHFYTYNTNNQTIWIGSEDTHDVWEAADNLRNRLEKSSPELASEFEVSFLKAMKRSHDISGYVYIERDKHDLFLYIVDENGKSILQSPNPKMADPDLIEFIVKASQRSRNEKLRKFYKMILSKLFSGTRRFNNKRQK